MNREATPELLDAIERALFPPDTEEDFPCWRWAWDELGEAQQESVQKAKQALAELRRRLEAAKVIEEATE